MWNFLTFCHLSSFHFLNTESPTSREWTFVETVEYAETPVTVDTHVTVTGTIPKKISKEDINHDTVRRRILPEIPVCNAENVASSGLLGIFVI